MMKNILLHIATVFWTVSVFSQQTDSLPKPSKDLDTINLLNEVEIIGDALITHCYGGNESVSIVRVINFEQSLTTLLQSKSLINISDYGGSGGVSFLQRRGTNSNQTPVIWNNVPINAITFGGFDLSLLDFESSSIYFGMHDGIFPGWNLNMRSQLYSGKEKYVEIKSSYSSANSIRNHFTGKYSTGKMALLTAFSHQYAKNNFYFKDVYKENSPRQRIEHNQLKQYGFQQDMRFDGKRVTYHSNIFFQTKQKEIPALMGSSRSGLSQQNDKTLRWSNNFVFDSTKHTYSITQGITYDYLNFTDKVHPDSSLYLDSRFHITQNYLKFLFESDTLMKFLFVSAGVDMSNFWVNTNNYAGLKQETNGSAFVILKGSYKNYEASIHLQQFIYSKSQYQRPLFAIYSGMSFMDKDLKISCLFSEKFKEPNFNDKYWVPGGNPDLENELGWNLEGNVNYSNRINRIQYSAFLTGYWMRFKNNIVWNPGFAGVYTPENISETSYKGLETGFDFLWNHNSVQSYCRVSYGFNRSIIEQYLNHSDLIGNVLSYRPQHILKVNTSGGWKYLFSGFDIQYYSKRYTDNDNNEVFSLPGYALFDWYLEGRFRRKFHLLSVQFKMNNLTNKSYQVIRSYAQPGRIYSLSFIYQFNKY